MAPNPAERLHAFAADLHTRGLRLIEQAQARRIRWRFTRNWIPRDELARYERELEQSGLPEEIKTARDWFYEATPGGGPGEGPGFGALDPAASRLLYGLVRHLQPEHVVETGVCNGASTAVLLQALEDNGAGSLVSIDLPDFVGDREPGAELWEGKGQAKIPEGREPGWMIPDRLRHRWRLVRGPSQEELEPVLEELRTIGMFVHDSEHSYECMTYEFETAYPRLCEGGILVSDDVTWNDAFIDFVDSVDAPTGRLGTDTRFLQKRASP